MVIAISGRRNKGKVEIEGCGKQGEEEESDFEDESLDSSDSDAEKPELDYNCGVDYAHEFEEYRTRRYCGNTHYVSSTYSRECDNEGEFRCVNCGAVVCGDCSESQLDVSGLSVCS